MTDFAQYDGYKQDFDFYVGPARQDDFRSREFGDRLWADVSRILKTPFDGGTITPDSHEGYNYWFDNDDLSSSLYSGPRESGSGVLDQMPAILTVISRSEDVASSELAERIYAGLTASDDYLVVVFAHNGMPIAAKFDIGDDW
ncbi:hypothetical protein [Streptomyces cadmiisoli]|uniref:Uncharacterized protein n=1 Tax=Streptomyces cadmiisoli TaxID=2184053 RepID=A0A2Z4JAA1_9ACTN|nr:hypothetical protein [Streptomyces cadmiisoli]AWW41986.1 hypothetical protein DN051_39685 [Streptomyces cadmiisoli]